ncbi:MAG: aromatic amino acid hydroxylase [Bdellovibrionales bacterium]
MTESTHARIPVHLRKYIVDQNYARYTSEDQAVWRYIMRQLKNFLSAHAHESYLDGLEKTGLDVERIPKIDDVDEHLERFGWGAVPVSGFIPPAAFMEFQSIGVLPIASDMRTLNHLLYTPAPDIVHEAAGHAPILVQPEYAAYLRHYGAVARHSIINKEDLDQYEAIRILSDIKEDPRSSPEEIRKAEARLNEVCAAMSSPSEAALLSRMNWWTAEYGLIGSLKEPKIFGAGLLSSVGESRHCLNHKVKKIPLSVECVNYSYDITEPQPQLFVAEDFAQLTSVLEDFATRLSFRVGGIPGLKRAIESRTVNSVQLNSGLQVAGRLSDFISSPVNENDPAYLKFEGPSQLAVGYQELPGHGPARHPHGFSSPVGLLRGETRCLSTFSAGDLESKGLRLNQRARLEFESGVVVSGELKQTLFNNGKLILLTFNDCKVTMSDQLLFDPAWGEFDMAVGSQVISVFGGPADRTQYGHTEDFAAKRIPPRAFGPVERRRHVFFQQIRDLRESRDSEETKRERYASLVQRFLTLPHGDWLPGVELVEISHQLGLPVSERCELIERLHIEASASSFQHQCVEDGLVIAERAL